MTRFVNRIADPKRAIDINAHFKNRSTLLLYICFCYYENRNVSELISLLLEKGANLNWYGDTSLYNLCKKYKGNNLVDLVRLFIEGANVSSQNDDEWNILHFLCNYYNYTNLKNLLELLINEKHVGKKNINATTLKLWWTPLHFLLK